MTAAAGDGLITDVEDVFGVQGFYGDQTVKKNGLAENLPTLGSTTEFSYVTYGPGDYRSSGYLSGAVSGCDSLGNIYVATKIDRGDPGTDRGVSIVKYSPNFKEVLWQHTIQNSSYPNENMQPYNFMVSENDNLYLVTRGALNGAYGQVAVLTRINTTTGAVIWSKGYSESNGVGWHISEDSSATYVYLAHYAYDGNSPQPMITKFAVSDGTPQWDKTYYWQSFDTEEAYGIQVLGSYIYLVGYSRPSSRCSFIVQVDTNGNLQNGHRWSHSNSSDSYANSITTDGTYLYVTGGGNGQGYYIAKFTSSLTLQAIKHFWDSPSSTNMQGKSIHYGSDGRLTVFVGGEININDNNRTGYAIVRHTTDDTLSQLNAGPTQCKGWHVDVQGNANINGFGDKQTICFGGSIDSNYSYHVCQFDVTDYANLHSNPVMKGLWEATFDSNINVLSGINSDTNPNTANGNASWSSNDYTTVSYRAPEVLSKGYYPEVLAADSGGMVMTHAVNITGYNKYVLDNVIDPNYLSSHKTNSQDFPVPTQQDGFGTSGVVFNRESSWNYQYQNAYVAAFKKRSKFFDIVKYTGNGLAGRQISHNLGCAPGMIWVKRISGGTGNWVVYHKARGAGKVMFVNGTDPEQTNGQYFWGDNTTGVEPTASTITLGSNAQVNGSGSDYIMYVWAHNDGDGDFGINGDLDIIKAGSYVGSGQFDGPYVDVGFQPQWILIKGATNTSDWMVVNTETNLTSTYWSNSTNPMFTGRSFLNTTDQVYNNIRSIRVFNTGFRATDSNGNWNTSGVTYTYIAIRKPTRYITENDLGEAHTTVYDSSYSRPELLASGGGKDFLIGHVTNSDSLHSIADRVTGGQGYVPGTSAYEFGGTYDNYFKIPTTYDHHWGNVPYQRAISGNPGYYNMWKQKGGFFDIVSYEGNGVAGRQIQHQLQNTPAMMWVFKYGQGGQEWAVYHKDINLDGDNNSATDVAYLNRNYVPSDRVFTWNDTAPTDTHFTVGGGGETNGSGGYFVAYLFGEVPGVSKMGTYTGNGSSDGTVVDCGFNGVPRYLLIKGVTSAEDWTHFSSERGLGNRSNDYYMTLNTTDTENSGVNWIEPTATGFKLKNGGTRLNGNGYRYIYYAIA